MNNKVLEGFKKDFLAIKRKGFVLSNRSHDTGIGKTFEDLIGVVENNNSLADYEDVLELKSSRELTKSMLTLFTMHSAFHPVSDRWRKASHAHRSSGESTGTPKEIAPSEASIPPVFDRWWAISFLRVTDESAKSEFLSSRKIWCS